MIINCLLPSEIFDKSTFEKTPRRWAIREYDMNAMTQEGSQYESGFFEPQSQTHFKSIDLDGKRFKDILSSSIRCTAAADDTFLHR